MVKNAAGKNVSLAVDDPRRLCQNAKYVLKFGISLWESLLSTLSPDKYLVQRNPNLRLKSLQQVHVAATPSPSSG